MPICFGRSELEISIQKKPILFTHHFYEDIFSVKKPFRTPLRANREIFLKLFEFSAVSVGHKKLNLLLFLGYSKST